MEEIKVSIITVAFNAEKTIARAIESVLNQTYPKIEYLILDGASTDSTVAIANSYNDAFHKKGYTYRIVSETDRGMYDALNKGAQKAQGELIGQINADDWYEADAGKLWLIYMRKNDMMSRGAVFESRKRAAI